MTFTSQIADELEATIQDASRNLRRLDEAMVTQRPAPDRWTIKEVVGHLIDSATNNHQRFVRAQLANELVFPKYEQNDWVRVQQYENADWYDLVDLWYHYNRHLVHVIRSVPAQSMAVRCTIGDNEPVTLEFLMQDYVAHLKHHLSKIRQRVENPQ
jgi:hypothetical protein